MNHTKTNYIAMLLLSIMFVGICVLPAALQAETRVYLDPIYSAEGKDIPLTIENLMDPNFPKPKNQLPVLFIPDTNPGPGEINNFRSSFRLSANGMPSFRDTLRLEANSSLGIEPYYMDFAASIDNEENSIAANARKIEEAVNLILLHQGEPEAKTKKVVIIAYGSGADSARFYLKDLWERQNKILSFHPVSELISILKPKEDANKAASLDFCAQLLAAANLPGSRENNEPIENGILYVTLEDEGNQDMTHMPGVIGKALYTAFYHQVAPGELQFQSSDEKNPLGPPIIPPLQMSYRDLGIVLLFDISDKMSRSLPAIQNAAEYFLQLLHTYCRSTNHKINTGIAVSPSPAGNDQNECRSKVIYPMKLVSETTITNAIKTIYCLKTQGNNPLLQGIDTALQMFGSEKRKIIILISNGRHDCPLPLNINIEDNAIKNRMIQLDDMGVSIYAIGVGQGINTGYDLLRKLTIDRPKHLAGKFIPVNEIEPGPSLHEAYHAIFSEITELDEADTSTTSTGIRIKTGFDKNAYHTGDMITITASVTKNGQPLPGLTGIPVLVTPLNTMQEPLSAESIKLYDDGSHGDSEKNDGVYTNQYSQTDVEGTYRFLFRADVDNIIKEKKESVYVSVKADPLYSTLKIQWQDIFTGRQELYLYDVEFKPADRFGNTIGPGHKVEVDIDYKAKVNENRNMERSFLLQENPNGVYSGEIGIMRMGINNGARLILKMDEKVFTIIEKIPGLKKWSLGVHAGLGFPVSNFKKRYQPGVHISGNIGYRLTPAFSVVGLLGYNYFSSSSPLIHNGPWWNISMNLRSEIVKNPLRFYINAGAGVYISQGGSFKSGVNIGTGAAYLLKSNYSIELGGDFHLVEALGSNSTFFVTHAGLIYRL